MRVFAAFTLLAGALGSLLLVSRPPAQRAQALLEYRPIAAPPGGAPAPPPEDAERGAAISGPGFVRREARLIASRPALERAVAAFGLEALPEYRGAADPEAVLASRLALAQEAPGLVAVSLRCSRAQLAPRVLDLLIRERQLAARRRALGASEEAVRELRARVQALERRLGSEPSAPQPAAAAAVVPAGAAPSERSRTLVEIDERRLVAERELAELEALVSAAPEIAQLLESPLVVQRLAAERRVYLGLVADLAELRASFGPNHPEVVSNLERTALVERGAREIVALMRDEAAARVSALNAEQAGYELARVEQVRSLGEEPAASPAAPDAAGESVRLAHAAALARLDAIETGLATGLDLDPFVVVEAPALRPGSRARAWAAVVGSSLAIGLGASLAARRLARRHRRARA